MTSTQATTITASTNGATIKMRPDGRFSKRFKNALADRVHRRQDAEKRQASYAALPEAKKLETMGTKEKKKYLARKTKVAAAPGIPTNVVPAADAKAEKEARRQKNIALADPASLGAGKLSTDKE